MVTGLLSLRLWFFRNVMLAYTLTNSCKYIYTFDYWISIIYSDNTPRCDDQHPKYRIFYCCTMFMFNNYFFTGKPLILFVSSHFILSKLGGLS